MDSGSAAGKSLTGALLALPLLLFLAAAVAWPLSWLAGHALSGPGWGAVRQVLAAGRYRTSLVNSLGLSAAAALGSVLLGRIGAIPEALAYLTGRRMFAGAAYTVAGLFLAYLYFELPRAVMTLESAFRRFPRELDSAARTLGAGPLQRLLKVGLPLAAPALRSTLAVTFSAAMGSFGVALILSRRFTVAPLEIYTEMTGFLNDEVAGALALMLAVSTLAVDRLLAVGKR